jgi:malate synthase
MTTSYPVFPSRPTRSLVFAFGLALLTALTVVTTPRASAGQEKLASSIRSTRDEVIATRDQLQATVDALAALAKQKEGTLKPAYDTFVAEVGRAHAKATATTARAAKMESEAKAHFGAWQKELDSISSDSLRKKGQKRLDAVQKSYSKVAGSLGRAGTSFNPYLSDLDDIRKILANDLTPGGIRAIRNTVGSAKFNLKIVRGHLADAIEELDRMQKSLSSTAGG